MVLIFDSWRPSLIWFGGRSRYVLEFAQYLLESFLFLRRKQLDIVKYVFND